MPLRSLSKLPGIVPQPCTKEVQDRNWDAVRLAISVIVNNLNVIQEANELTVGGDSDDGAVVQGRPRWAISLYDGTDASYVRPAAHNSWRGLLKAIPCDNSKGANPAFDATIWVVLPGREGVDQDLPFGSVFAYEKAEDGDYVILSDYTKSHRIRWGKAQSDSTDHEVVVRECDDVDGTNPVAPDLTVLLPTRAGYNHDVSTDDVIAFVEAADGTLVCVTDYTLVEEVARFALTASLTPAGSATGEFLEWDGAAYAGTGTFATFYDWDSPGRWRGPSGYRGVAIRKKDSGRWEIIYLESIAQWITVSTTAAFSGGTSAGASVSDYWNGNDPGTTVDVHSPAGMFDDVADGIELLCHYNWTDGRYEATYVVPTSSQKLRWGVAQANWVNASTPYVSVKYAAGGPESTTVTGDAFNVLLPRTHEGDPNVETGNLIAYLEDDDGDLIAVSPYMDDKIFTVKMWIGTPAAVPQGWAIMDGTDNATLDGGSGIDTTEHFLFSKTDTGVAVTEGTDVISAVSASGAVSITPASTGITIAAHPHHVHYMCETCGACQDTTAPPSNYVLSFADTHLMGFEDSGGYHYTGIPQTYEAGTHVDEDHEDLTLSHNDLLTDPGHTHATEIAVDAGTPAKVRLYVIERVNNSTEAP